MFSEAAFFLLEFHSNFARDEWLLKVTYCYIQMDTRGTINLFIHVSNRSTGYLLHQPTPGPGPGPGGPDEPSRHASRQVLLGLSLSLFGAFGAFLLGMRWKKGEQTWDQETDGPWIPWEILCYHLVMTNSLPWNISIFKNGKPSINGPWLPWLC